MVSIRRILGVGFLLMVAAPLAAQWDDQSCNQVETRDSGAENCTKVWQVNAEFAYYNCGGLSTSKTCDAELEP